MNNQEDRYLSLTELRKYSGLSISTLKVMLRGPDGIPHFNTGGKILVKKSEFDRWIERYRAPVSATPPDKIPPDKIHDLTHRILEELKQFRKVA